MMSFKVLEAETEVDYKEWIYYWERTDKDVFYHPNYVRLYTDDICSFTRCAIYENDENLIIYPFILRDMKKESFCPSDIKKAFDIITPYGYGGPIYFGSMNIKEIANQFWKEFTLWVNNNNIVSEFIRFALNPEYQIPYIGEYIYYSNNIECDLTIPGKEYWMIFEHKVRKNVKKALKNDIQIKVDYSGEYLDIFLQIYYSTMERRSADESYFFPKSYFLKLIDTLANQFVLFHAFYNNKIISTELVLSSEKTIYSFLGGTYSEFYDLRPNDLLKYEIINWGRENNKLKFNLGGGYKPGDGIYKYKYSFAPNGEKPFYIGKKIYNSELYNQMVEEKMKNINDENFKSDSNFFPLYRENYKDK